MVRSLAVILVPVVLITWFFTRSLGAPPVQTVDWKPVLNRARAEAGFPIYAPASLSSGYRVNKASWAKRGQPGPTGNPVTADQWELGMLNPDDIYVELDEQNHPDAAFVPDSTRQGVADGQSNVSGTTWTRLVSPDDRTRSLVHTSGAVTVLVSGDLGYAALESFAGSLTTS